MTQESLLWFDDTPTRSVADKVARAIARYQYKFHHDPDACYVHPSVADGSMTVDGVRVLPSKSVPPHHFWLGERNGKERTSTQSG